MSIWSFSWCLRPILLWLRSVLWFLRWLIILSIAFRNWFGCLWPTSASWSTCWFACIFRLSPLFHRWFTSWSTCIFWLSPLFHRRFACWFLIFSIRLNFNIDIHPRCLWSVLRLLSPLFYNRFNYCFYNWFNDWSNSWSLNWLFSWFLTSSLRSIWLCFTHTWLFIILLSSYSPF